MEGFWSAPSLALLSYELACECTRMMRDSTADGLRWATGVEDVVRNPWSGHWLKGEIQWESASSCLMLLRAVGRYEN